RRGLAQHEDHQNAEHDRARSEDHERAAPAVFGQQVGHDESTDRNAHRDADGEDGNRVRSPALRHPVAHQGESVGVGGAEAQAAVISQTVLVTPAAMVAEPKIMQARNSVLSRPIRSPSMPPKTEPKAMPNSDAERAMPNGSRSIPPSIRMSGTTSGSDCRSIP